MLLVKIQKNTNYEGNILEFQKDLIKEDNNKNKVEVMTTNKEEKYRETPYRCLFFCLISHDHPFTAPSVSPLIKYFWKKG